MYAYAASLVVVVVVVEEVEVEEEEIRNSSVDTPTDDGLDVRLPGRGRSFAQLHNVHIGFEALPSSYTVRGGKEARG